MSLTLKGLPGILFIFTRLDQCQMDLFAWIISMSGTEILHEGLVLPVMIFHAKRYMTIFRAAAIKEMYFDPI